MYEQDYKKLVSEGAEYLIGTCEPLFMVTSALDEQLMHFCNTYLCGGITTTEKFHSRLRALEERFEQDVADEMERLEYFNCETCGWWCWGDERSTSKEGQICRNCHEEDEDDE